MEPNSNIPPPKVVSMEAPQHRGLLMLAILMRFVAFNCCGWRLGLLHSCVAHLEAKSSHEGHLQ